MDNQSIPQIPALNPDGTAAKFADLKMQISEFKKLAESNRKEADELRAAIGVGCDFTHKEALLHAAHVFTLAGSPRLEA